jgi:hypothetical protein
MRYFYDTEFLEDGHTIDLISIGIVADDGRELYAVAQEVGEEPLRSRIRSHDWLMMNVVPHLPLKPGTASRPSEKLLTGGGRIPGHFVLDDASNVIMPRRMIRNAVRDFLLANDGAELWADFGAYDHVALCQLFGSMVGLPPGLTMFTNEFQQAWRARGCPALPPPCGGLHNALEDARYLRACFDVTFRPSEPVWSEPRAKPEKSWEGPL